MDSLVDAAASGSNAAWTQLVQELGPAVRGFARARGIDDPDELTQEVFLDAARSIGRFDGDRDAFRSWLFTIAYRRVADHHRRTGRRPKTVPLDRHSPGPADPGPEQQMVYRESVRELLKELDVLSDLERDVVLLRVVGELSSDEVSTVVGKSPGNVRVIQTRALARLRANLERNLVTNSVPQRLPS